MGHGEEERVAQCGALHAVPSLQCSGDQLLRGEVSEDSLHRQHPGLALAQLDMDTRTAAPEHAELVAGICGLHVAAGDILRVVAASAQLLSALVKKVNRILITQSKDFINEIDILIIAALLHCSVHICVCRYIYIFTSVFLCFVYDLKIKY